jgi:hypothetical protein
MGRVDLAQRQRALGSRLDRPSALAASRSVFDGQFIVATSLAARRRGRPFLQAREIAVNAPLSLVGRVQHRERRDVDGDDGGAFPAAAIPFRFKREQQAGGKSPITVSVAYVRTRRGVRFRTTARRRAPSCAT